MKKQFTATAKKNPGRKSYVISFRHPLKMEGSRPGKKVFKGLGTADPTRAAELEQEMNDLLAREDLHSVGSRNDAAKDFSDTILDIFYGDLDPTSNSHRSTRERLLALPLMGVGLPARTYILGNSGVGKSTLLRRLIGCDSELDKFPAVSTNRTTTCEIEIITGVSDYSAVVTFLTRNQTQQEVIEALSNAVLKAMDTGDDDAVMKDLLDDPDQRFRLKYAIGGWNPTKITKSGSLSFGASPKANASKPTENSPFLSSALAAIRAIATNARTEVELILGELDALKEENRSYALDEMQSAAEGSDSFQDLVSEIMEEIEIRFSALIEGKLIKSSTGWPEAWTLESPPSNRETFLRALRWFSSNAKDEWGKLLTPLVTGIRAAGPFRPAWVPTGNDYHHVLIDTQGLDHERPTTELSSETTSVFGQVNNILFVESGKDSLKSQSARKVMEAIAGAGYTSNLTVVLTHMDLVVGDDIPTDEDRKSKAFNGLRSLIENEVSRNVSRDAARQLETHLENSTFYLAYLDPKKYPENWDEEDKAAFGESLGEDLFQLTTFLTDRADPTRLQPSVPEYSFESLGLAVREASVAFQEVWEARLGYKRVEGISSASWQGIKAMSRRHAEGWFDSFWLRPVDTLISLTRNVLTRFLENPLKWNPDQKVISEAEKAAIIDRMKQIVNDELTKLSRSRLWETSRIQWQGAYAPTGTGSTEIRRNRVHDLFLQQVPIPQSISDRQAQAWVEDVKQLLIKAVELLREEIEGN